MKPINLNEQEDLIFMLMALGDAYLEKGLYAEAARKYHLLLEMNAVNQNLYTNLSKAYIGLKKFDPLSFTIFQKAIQYDGDNTELYHILAASFYKEKRQDPYAIQIYEKAIQQGSPIFRKLAEHLAAIYFRNEQFPKCQEITENILKREGFQARPFALFYQSCWKQGRFDDAIHLLKRLTDASKDRVLWKYLCLSFLEKKLQAQDQNKQPPFSAIDRQLMLDFLNGSGKFRHLEDLNFYLDLKLLLFSQTTPGEVNTKVHGIRKPTHNNGSPNVSAVAEWSLPSDMELEILQRLTPFHELAGKTSRSPLTFDDIAQSGAAILAEAGPESVKCHFPGKMDVVLTMQLSRKTDRHNGEYAPLNGESDPPEKVDGHVNTPSVLQKWFAILDEQLPKYNLKHIWGTRRGLVFLTDNVFSAVSFAVEIQNQLSRYNFMNQSNEEIHLSVGIHGAKQGLDKQSPQAFKDLAIAVKIGTVREKDVVLENAEHSKIFRKKDRIFLTGEAFHQVESSNRFRVQPVGKFKIKYLEHPLELHEVVWRNPIYDLQSGFITRLGRFDLLAELNSTGIFRVYKAKDSILQRFVIVKVVQSKSFNALPMTNQQKMDFYELAKSHGQISYPNFVNIYEVDDDHGLTYLAREFVEGNPISATFQDEREFNAERFIQIVYQICKALSYIHQSGFYHLNLKPNNILLSVNDEIKIMDFIIPTDLFEDYNQLQQANDRFFYQAPEQIQGKPGDHRSDIFALGTILYQMVTRIHPFANSGFEIQQAVLYKQPPVPSALNQKLPKFFDHLIFKCLAKEPEGRFQSLQEIISLFRRTFNNNLFSNFNYQIAQSRDAL